MFDQQAIQSDILSSNIVDYHPRTAENAGPIEFLIPGSSDDYLDLSYAMVDVRFRIQQADGKNIEDAHKVGLNNLPIATLFRDVSLTIGDQQVEGGQSDYPYKSYLNALTQFHPAAQRSHMQAMGWYRDEAAKFDNDTNTGFVKRSALIKDSKVCQLYGPLNLDFFRQSKFLLCNTSMRLKLTLNKPEFLLNAFGSVDKFKIHVEDITIYIRRVSVNPSVIRGHAEGLNRQNAVYPIQHTKLLTFTIPKGQKSFMKDSLFPSEAPKFLMVAMVENDAFNGAIKKNPFHFKHNDLSEIALRVNGVSHPGPPYRPDFSSSQFLRSYVDFMDVFRFFNTDDTNGLTMEEFKSGYTIYAFDLTADSDISAPYRQANVPHNIRLDLEFKATLSETINVLIYAVFDSSIEISKYRDVILHYNR
ncbi:MAG: hypothetical protein AAGK05_12265 [Pseudomonadota bacterium]